MEFTDVLALLRVGIGLEKPRPMPVLSPADAAELYRFGKHFDLLYLLADAAEACGRFAEGGENPPDFAPFAVAKAEALYRSAQLQTLKTRIGEELSAAGIVFMPLKGAVSESYYPHPAMRVGCDLDILIRPADAGAVHRILTDRLGGVPQKPTGHDTGFVFPGGAHAEIHTRFFEEKEMASDLLPDPFDGAAEAERPADGLRMDETLFLFYHVAHMAKHFAMGGCGIRPFADLALLRGREHDGARLETLLKKAGLDRFAAVVFSLTAVWFDDAAPNEDTKKMQAFLLNAERYGGAAHRTEAAMADGGRLGYLRTRLFPPKAYLQIRYPRLAEAPLLYPWYWVRRTLRFFGSRKRRRQELFAWKAGADQARNFETAAYLRSLGL